MSKSPFMIDCPACVRDNTIPGEIAREYGTIKIKDICDKCGGSGRIAVMSDNSHQYKLNRRFAKGHKIEMKKWLEIEKELLYGKAERLG